MSWLERISEAHYTSPSGKETVFSVETASRETELKTGVYTFPGKDGAHVQHQGVGAKTFPLSCIFNGETCMDDADGFEAMLVERGVGQLRHPIYGTLKVVPTGNISREDDLTSRLNESVVAVTFTETLTDTPAVEKADADVVEELFEMVLDLIAVEYAAVEGAELPPLKTITESLAPLTGNVAFQAADEETVADEDREPLIRAANELRTASIDLAAIIRDSADDLGEVDAELEAELIVEADTLEANASGVTVDVEAGADAFQDELDNAAADVRDREAEFEQWRTEYRKAREPTKAQIALRKFQAKLGKVANKVAGMAKKAAASTRSAYARMQAGLARAEAIQVRSLNTARNALNMLKIPSRLAISVSEKIRGYSLLTARIANQFKHDPLGLKQIAGAFASAKLTLFGAIASAVSGAVLSLSTDAGNSAASRRETVDAANQLIELLESVNRFCDEKTATNAFIDADADSSLALAELVYTGAHFVLDTAFALPLQKTVILDRNRQVIELCAELYGSTDRLDDFIRQNDFNINEIELLPMGKEVNYYIA